VREELGRWVTRSHDRGALSGVAMVRLGCRRFRSRDLPPSPDEWEVAEVRASSPWATVANLALTAFTPGAPRTKSVSPPPKRSPRGHAVLREGALPQRDRQCFSRLVDRKAPCERWDGMGRFITLPSFRIWCRRSPCGLEAHGRRSCKMGVFRGSRVTLPELSALPPYVLAHTTGAGAPGMPETHQSFPASPRTNDR